MLQTQVYPHHLNIDWGEYCNWVSSGFGDETVQEIDTDKLHKYMIKLAHQELRPSGVAHAEPGWIFRQQNLEHV